MCVTYRIAVIQVIQLLQAFSNKMLCTAVDKILADTARLAARLRDS